MCDCGCGNAVPPPTGRTDQQAGSGCPGCHNCLAQVDILDCENGQGDATRFQGTVNQWVNLPQEERFASALEGLNLSGRQGGSGQVTLDRLGSTFRILVQHDLYGSAGSVEVRLVPTAGNITYTDRESPNNSQYRRQWAVWHPASRTSGAYILNLQVDVGGANEFTIEVRCSHCQTPMSPGRIVVRRRIWLIPIAMNSPNVSVPDLSSFRTEFARCKLDVTTLPLQTMPDIRTIGSGESKRELLNNALAAYRTGRAHRFQPFVVAALYVDQIANKMQLPLSSRNFGRGTLNFLTSQNPSATPPVYKYLWRNMGPGEQWLESAVFREHNGTEWDVSSHCSTGVDPALPTFDPSNMHNQVRVDVDSGVFAELQRRYPRETWTTAPGTLNICVNVVRSFTAGYAITNPSSRTNVIVIAVRSHWQASDANWIFGVLAHELGHKLGLVADGEAQTNVECDLQRSQMRYVERGHTGPHCRYGILGSLTDPIQPEGTCLMFGGSSNQPITQFCGRCSDAIRKVDLPGFETFNTGLYTSLRSVYLTWW